jgi:hypothetical protein
MRVPFTADFQLRQMLEHVGLNSAPELVRTQRTPTSMGIGPSTSGREANWPPRPKPLASHMRSERPAPPRKP